MQFNTKLLLLLFSIGAIVTGCTQKTEKADSDQRLATGRTEEIMIVCADDIYTGSIKDTFENIFLEAYPGLPQLEPRFSIYHVQPSDFGGSRKYRKNVIFVHLLESEAPENREVLRLLPEGFREKHDLNEKFIFQSKNTYASGQDILYLFTRNGPSLKEKLSKNKQKLQSIFEEKLLEYTTNKLFNAGSNKKAEQKIDSLYPFTLTVPKSFAVARATSDFLWVREVQEKYDHNIFISWRDYKSKEQLSDSALIKWRNDITEKYILFDEDTNTYMLTEDYIPVECRTDRFLGNYAKECRGLWIINNRPMGGPFMSIVFVDENNGLLYYLDGFVYAPELDKIDLIRNVEAILRTFKLKADI